MVADGEAQVVEGATFEVTEHGRPVAMLVPLRAASFMDPSLRALDAVHLATALSIGDHPEAFITYDARLATAASKQRLKVAHPGAPRL
jgi:antitoxin (DNA-binding transcriptional repressor) of toxin-antitoxin stability system